MKKKLCIAIGDHPITYCGGLGIRFNKMIKELENEFEIKIFTFYDCTVHNKISNTPVYDIYDIISLQYASKLSYNEKVSHILCGIGIIEKLIQLSWKPDVILVSDHILILPGFQVSRVFNCKFIIEFDLALFSYQNIYNKDELNMKNRLHSEFINDIENMGCNTADLVIACSEFYEKVCPYNTKRILTVENGINLEEFDVDISYSFPNSNEINLVYIGRLNSQKGLDLMLNLRLPENINLYFVGPDRGGGLCEIVKHYCEKIKNFYYLGEKKGEEKIAIMKNADAILFPSRHEPFGIVGLECMASKTLCITTRVDGIASYMDKDMCIEIENFDMKRAINEFLNMSEEEKNKRIEKAYNRVQNYTWNRISKKMVETIKTVFE